MNSAYLLKYPEDFPKDFLVDIFAILADAVSLTRAEPGGPYKSYDCTRTFRNYLVPEDEDEEQFRKDSKGTEQKPRFPAFLASWSCAKFVHDYFFLSLSQLSDQVHVWDRLSPLRHYIGLPLQAKSSAGNIAFHGFHCHSGKIDNSWPESSTSSLAWNRSPM